jgi:large subunit ribosomal protein L13
MSTYFPSKEEGLENRKWFLVDASGIPVGRIASQIAALLRGKHKPTFSRQTDCGDFVIVVNSDRAIFTGNKGETKIYRHHTGFPGGVKSMGAGDALRTKSDWVIKAAVKTMLPRGPLGRAMFTKLKVYMHDKHDHVAQQPMVFQLKAVKKAA